MKNLSCKHCGLVDDYKVVEKNNHQIAYCNGCGKYIKHLPHSEPTFFFGKYKGKLVSEVNDADYLQWVWANVKMGEAMRNAVDLQLQSIHKTIS